MRAFDAMTTRRKEKPTWTLEAIGALIGTGPDFVKTLTRMDGSPIRQIGGRWFCYESELLAWMKASQPS